MSIKDVLRAYGEQKATLDAVMRSLVLHNGWLVDAVLAQHITKAVRFETLMMLGTPTNISANEFWFYTDPDAVNVAVAKGAQLGTYAGYLGGTALFSAVPSNYAAVRINPGCATDETWFIPQESFAFTALWAQAIALEKQLDLPASPEKLSALRDYEGYMLLKFPEQDAIVTAVDYGGLRNPAMVFTAIDCANQVREENPQLKLQVVSGRKLFSMLPHQGVDGVVFNPFGPGATAVFDLSICADVLQEA